ncbi:hypothetical protein RHMOL_Rhmol02G0306700 [Rhododendron molle]|uniref:Uncharacterized protein n=1 Tax=Rhododendron molle TaxID=49168 RepID=A0ACC0PVP3_RHOML|nr:hypothetical protein RHMOL_Rhmol02G0306700 [Rhododendron molle]
MIFKEELGHTLVQFWTATRTLEGRTLLTTQFQPFALGRTSPDLDQRNRLCSYRMGMCREYNNSYADAECAEELLGLPGRVFLHQFPESTPDVKLYTLKEYPQRDLALRCWIGSSVAVPVFEHSSHNCVGVLEIVSQEFMAPFWHENLSSAKSMTFFRMAMCREYNNKFYADAESGEEQLGLPGRVFLNQLPESTPHVRRYTLKEYPQLDLALLYGIQSSWAVPVFDHSSHTCVGVLEIVSLRVMVQDWHDISFLGQIYDIFQEFGGLLCLDEHKHYEMQIGDKNKASAFQELKTRLETVCKIHDLPKNVHNVVTKAQNYNLQLGHLDQPPMDAISNGMNVVTKAQNYNLPSVEPLQSGKVTSQLDSSDQLSMDHSKNVHNVVTAEQNIIPITSSDSEVGPRETQERQHKNTGVRIEVSLDDILKYSKESRTGAAKKLQGAQPLFSFTDNFAGLIRHAIKKLVFKSELDYCLVQFWAATKTSEGRTLLTTQFQPFALGRTYVYDDRADTNRLCEYRMGMCREYNNSFYVDAESGEDQLGLPGRVFLNQLPESTQAVEHYTPEEYPQRDLALRCKIGLSLALPVFEHSSHTCVGVLEIVSPYHRDIHLHNKEFLGRTYDIFQEVGLQCFDGYKHSELQIGDENKAGAFQELKTVLETVCKIHELPLAMTWVPCSACNYLLRGKPEGVEFFERWITCQARFIEVSKCSHLTTGVVAGMVLSSSNILYCSDITQLSLVEYPLVPYARLCEFRGWFTICLQSNYTANDIYVLEFFLPSSSNNSWTSLSLILGTMVENFKTFKLASGQELGDLLSVEVMDFQKGRKLHSRKKIQAKGGGVRLQLRQLDQVSTGAIHSGMNVISEDQNIPRLEAVQNGEVTMQLDSSHQPPLDPPNNGQHVIIAERNISTVSSLEERKRKIQRVDKGTGVRIEVSLEDILKCAKMSRANAAEKLQVSVSTLKRVCRRYGMDRWAPHNIEKFRSFWPSLVENEGQTRQRLNCDLPPNQGLDCVAHTKPAFHDLPSNQALDTVARTKAAFQDADIVTIKAKYENNMIKFRLCLPSRLVALQQEVANRLNLEAGTYYIRYEDEENDLILIACDQDLQDCIDTFKSLGTSVVVLLEPK